MPAHNPWGTPPPPPSRLRVAAWLGLLALVALLLWKLSAAFPDAIATDLDSAYFIRMIGVLALVSTGVLFARRFSAKEVFRNIAIWTAIALVFALAYAYQTEIGGAMNRLRAELVPSYPISDTPHELVLTASANGHFYVVGEANGAPVRFLIDTGASDIVLSPADAKRLGIDVADLDFSRAYQTANGAGLGAPYRLDSLTIGTMTLTDVPVSVNKADMPESLLGMAFLKSVSAFEIRDRKLMIRWRGP